MSTLTDPTTGEAFPYHTRAGWGARAPRQRTPFSATPNMKVRHHADAPTPHDLATSAATMRAIQNWHMDHNGWSDIAYNYGVNEFGIFEGRGIGYVGGHTLGHNFHTIGVVYVGDGASPVPAVAFRAWRALERWIDAFEPGAILHEVLHSDLNETACPARYITEWHHAGSPTTGSHPPPPPPPPPGGHCHYQHQGAQPRLLHLTYANLPGSWMRGADVAEIQYLLDVINGFDAHSVPVDGVWGTSTAAALERFQAIWNVFRPDLRVDGVCGPVTRAAICEVLNLKGIWK